MARIPEKRLIAIIIVIIVLLLAGFGIYTFFWWQKTKSLKITVAALRLKSADFAKITTKVDEMNVELAGLDDFVLKASEILPSDKEAGKNGFLELLGRFIEKSGVTQKDLTPPAAGETERQFTRYRYQVTVTGETSEIVKFINEFESHERFFKIDAFNISIDRLGAGVWPEDEKRCTLSISTYTYKSK